MSARRRSSFRDGSSEGFLREKRQLLLLGRLQGALSNRVSVIATGTKAGREIKALCVSRECASTEESSEEEQ